MRMLLLACVLCPCLALAAVLLGCRAEVSESGGPGKIFTGPRFWTGDPAQPWADAVLVSGPRVVRLLSKREIPQWIAKGASAEVLPGELAVPGLVDAHAHIRGYGMTLGQVNLVAAVSLEETLERIKHFAEEHQEERWVQGRGWDQNDWPDAAWPDADRLDQLLPERPAAMRRIDGHALWVNRAALDAAGINDETPDPPGGSIHRDRSGRATGILVDQAMDLVFSQIPEPGVEDVERALADAASDLVAVGLTGVHDMGVDTITWQAMKRLAAQGRFPLSVFAYASADSALYRELLETGPQHEGRLHLVGVKLYADGALGSRGARLIEPYSDDAASVGLWVTEPEELLREIERSSRAGLQPAVHAIGDAANRAVLDAWESLGGTTAQGPALRLEHAQILHPDDLPRPAALGVVASMQPTHASSDMPWAQLRLGEKRLAGAYAWRSMLDSGALLAFGSDFPVEDIDPRLGLYAAVTRQDAEGYPPGGWLPEQRLSIQEALRAFTLGAAEAVSSSDRLGTISAGRYADFTVFDRDILEGPPSRILDAKISATVISSWVYLPGRDETRTRLKESR